MEKMNQELNNTFDRKDLMYITKNLLTMDEIIERSKVSSSKITEWIERGEFPEPTYVTSNGKRWYPRYIVILIQRSNENGTSPKDEFINDAKKVIDKSKLVYRFGRVEETNDSDDELEKMWTDFRFGLYGACLRVPDPKNILSKGELISKIQKLLEKPDPSNASWCDSLEKCVNELDKVEAEFTSYDRVRFGGQVSRDIFVTDVKKKYPQIFRKK